MGLFARKKKTAEPVSEFRMFNGIKVPLDMTRMFDNGTIAGIIGYP